jgi:hypothetical protein
MRVLSRGLLLLGIAVALTSIAGVVLNYSPVPWWDQWFGNVDWYMKAEQSWWPAFWSLHNEHRLLFSRLIFYPDMRWFGGVNILSFIGNVVMCGVMALAIWRAAIYRADLSRDAKIAFTGISLAFCFSWMQSNNFTWAFQNQWFAVGVFALLAFHGLSVSFHNGYSRRWFVAALLAGLASALSMANGNLVWALFLPLMVYWRFPSRFIVVAAVTAVVEVIGYFYHAQGATGSLPHGTFRYVITHDPIGLVRYALAYLGSPAYYAFGRFGEATLGGLLVVGGALLGVVTALKNRDMKAMPLLALTAFICITALATGVGRLTLGLENVFQSRYATNGLLAWVSILLFWIVNSKRETVKTWLHGGTGIALLMIVICQPAALRVDHDMLFQRLVAGQAMRQEVFDKRYEKILWDAGDAIQPIVIAAKKEQISILRPAAMGYDNPPARIEATEVCRGGYDSTKPTETPGWQRAEGWVYTDGKEARTVVITDTSGTTVGEGVVGALRPDAATAVGSKNQRLGWVAFYRETPDIHVFAKTSSGYCRLR